LTAACSWVGLTNVVGLVLPFQRTTEVETKPLPFTVSVKSAPAACAVAGDRLLRVGTGGAGGRTGMDRALQDWSALSTLAAFTDRMQTKPPKAAPLA
jgi:hypothetical protein